MPFELIQGFRRLTAFKQLAEETGDLRYTRIPAAMVPRGAPLVDLYRKMVDENLIRKDLSFGEMAQLALSYARDEGIPDGEAIPRALRLDRDFSAVPRAKLQQGIEAFLATLDDAD